MPIETGSGRVWDISDDAYTFVSLISIYMPSIIFLEQQIKILDILMCCTNSRILFYISSLQKPEVQRLRLYLRVDKHSHW